MGSVQFSLSHVQLFATTWTAARQASLSITNSQSLLKLMSIELVVPSDHLILCRPLLLLPSIFPSIRVFSNESVLHIRWPKYLNHCEPQAPHPNMAMRLNLLYRVSWRSERNCTWKLHGTKKHLSRWKLLPWLMSGSIEMLLSSSRWQKMDLQTRGLSEVQCA